MAFAFDLARWEALAAVRTRGDVGDGIASVLAMLGRPDVISFAGGFPDPETFPRERVATLLQEFAAAGESTAFQYAPTRGLAGALDVLAARLERQQGRRPVENELLITSGGIEALELIGKSFVDPGDAVVVEAPTYLGAIQSFRSFEADLVPAGFDENGLDVAELQQLLADGLRPKLLYTIPDHQNPAGVSLAADRRATLVELARFYGFLVVEDVAYRELGFAGESLPSLWSLGPDIVVQVGTTSKTLFPGIRLGLGGRPGRGRRSARRGEAGDRSMCRRARAAALRGVGAARLDRRAAFALAGALPAQVRADAGRARALAAGVGAVDDAAWRLLLVADAAGGRRRRVGRAGRRAGGCGRSRDALLSGQPGQGQHSPLLQPRRRGEDRRRDRAPRVDLVTEPKATHRRWDDLPKEPLKDDLSRRLIATDRMMLAQVFLEKGCVVPLHSHENEQLTYILEGKLRFWLGEDESETVDVGAGEVLHIPSWLPHKAEALETTLDVDIFTPPRQDWLDGSDAYLRSK